MLWIRPLNSGVAQPMSGTEGATYPFWSADSRYVGILRRKQAEQARRQRRTATGPLRCFQRTGRNLEQYWHHRVRAGYHLRPFARRCRWGHARRADHAGQPRRLPIAGPIFFLMATTFSTSPTAGTSAESGIYLAALDSKDKDKDRKLLLRNDSNAIYAAPGYLLFVRDNTLMAQRFNLRSLALEGEAKALVDHVAVNTDTWRSVLTASANGELLYQHGAAGGGSQLVWYDSSGKQGEPVLPETADYYRPSAFPRRQQVGLCPRKQRRRRHLGG